jgi:AbiV family abortive infection protein
MNEQELNKFNNFRQLCLTNSEDAIRTAETLLNKNVNHIVLQLVVFGLEEVGKIFVGWYNINAKESWDKVPYNIPLDDHIKKLFWAIWGPSFMNEKFTQKQMDDIRNMASNLHNKRLEVMYAELTDTVPSSAKITDEEAEVHVKMARARLELAKLEGEVETQLSEDKQEDMNWFMEATNHPDKRKYIFGNQSQEKLIELGDVKNWIAWLKVHFETEANELKELLQKELEKTTEKEKDFTPKWKIRIKLTTPSHSIRANVLTKFNSHSPLIQFAKGADNHTLMIDFILDKKTPIKGLWHHGWNYSNIFVAALNVGTNGLFYWNITVNLDKYYEQIWDLESNRRLEAKLETSFQLDWSSRNMYLREEELVLTFMSFRYFSSIVRNEEFEPVNNYMMALGMLAKNDMHLRLEPQCLLNFFYAFKKALIINENCTDLEVKEVGYKQLEKMLKGREEYDKVLDLAIELEGNQGRITRQFSLTDIIAMKQYSGTYFLTLATRKIYGDKAILLTQEEPTEK